MNPPLAKIQKGSRKVFSDTTKALIERGWQTVLQTRPAAVTSGTLFDSPLLRVESVEGDTQNIALTLVEDVFYKDVTGLRAQEFLSVIPSEDVFTVLSCMLMPKTSDGVALLIERDSGDWNHSLELPGSFVTRVRIEEVDMRLDKYAYLLALRELGLSEGEILDIDFREVVDFKTICEYMLVVSVSLRDTFASYDAQYPGRFFRADSIQTIPLHRPSETVLRLFEMR